MSHCSRNFTAMQELFDFPPSRRRKAQYILYANNGCWLWHGITDNRYGTITINGKRSQAHNHIYEKEIGPIPEGLELDHLCRVKSCVNPEHLYPVTHMENTRRSHGVFGIPGNLCIHGHEMTEENTYTRPNGEKECRDCKLQSMRSFYLRKNGRAVVPGIR